MAKEGKYMNNDVFFDVLSRLPAGILVGLKRVSTGWHRLISNAGFVRAQLQRAEPGVSGFVFQQKFHWSRDDIKTNSYLHTADAVQGSSSSSRVHHDVFDFLPDDVVALASCNGLFCCRSCFPAWDPAVFVCNPLTKQWAILPWTGPDYHQGCLVALAFDPRRDFDRASADFTLVMLHLPDPDDSDSDDDTTRCFSFEVFSSRTGEWTRATEVCRADRGGQPRDRGVYIDGVVHWLTCDGDRILTFGLESKLPGVVSVPELSAFPQSCIGESGGKLHYVAVSEEGLSLWSRAGPGPEWRLEHWLSLEAMEREYPEWFRNLRERVAADGGAVAAGDPAWASPLAFEAGVLLMRVATGIYLYSFAAGKAWEVCDVAELGSNSMVYPTVLPYRASLVPLV